MLSCISLNSMGASRLNLVLQNNVVSKKNTNRPLQHCRRPFSPWLELPSGCQCGSSMLDAAGGFTFLIACAARTVRGKFWARLASVDVEDTWSIIYLQPIIFSAAFWWIYDSIQCESDLFYGDLICTAVTVTANYCLRGCAKISL